MFYSFIANFGGEKNKTKNKCGQHTSNRHLLLKSPESATDRSAELSDLDARLQALQEYMRDLDTGH